MRGSEEWAGAERYDEAAGEIRLRGTSACDDCGSAGSVSAESAIAKGVARRFACECGAVESAVEDVKNAGKESYSRLIVREDNSILVRVPLAT